MPEPRHACISVRSTKSLSDVQPVRFPFGSSEQPAHLDQCVTSEASFSKIPEHKAGGVLIVAWALILARHTNAENVAFMVGRHSDSCLDFNVLNFEYDLACDQSLSRALEDAQDVTSSMWPSQPATDNDPDWNSVKHTSELGHRNILLLPGGEPDGEASQHKLPIELHEGYSLVVDCRRVALGEAVTVHFDSKALAPLLADHLLKHLCRMVELVEEEPHLSIKDSDFATETDFDKINSWILPCTSPTAGRMLYSGFEDHVQSSPKSVAIRETEMVMTYEQLDSHALVLAKALREHCMDGVVGNVGIVFEKSAFAVVSMLGIWKAKGAYVPMDPAAPPMRLKTIISNAGIQVMLCSKAHYSMLQDFDLGCPIIQVDARYLRTEKKAQAASEAPTSTNETQPSTSDLAVVIYTSGSTGTPKGVALSHRALTTSIETFGQRFPLDQDTRTFQYAAFTFDISIADIWMTLGQGGCVCLPTEDERLDMVNFVQEQHCTYTCLTTSVVSTMPVSLVRDHQLKFINLCGEPVTKGVVKKFAGEDFRFTSCYGPSEASVYCTLTGPFERKSDPLDIGLPVGGSVTIVDANDPHRLAPVGCVGELVIFGNTLADGYYNDPEKTNAAFRTDLKWMSRLSLDRVYLTNDLVRYTETGTMIYVGRKTGYIKMNGHRIEPGEIESQLLTHTDHPNEDKNAPENEDINVCVQDYEAETKDTTSRYLVCFFTHGAQEPPSNDRTCLKDHDAPSHEQVERWTADLRTKLPEYMIPRLFVPVSFMPRTLSGKADKARLKRMLAELGVDEVMRRFGGGDSEGSSVPLRMKDGD